MGEARRRPPDVRSVWPLYVRPFRIQYAPSTVLLVYTAAITGPLGTVAPLKTTVRTHSNRSTVGSRVLR